MCRWLRDLFGSRRPGGIGAKGPGGSGAEDRLLAAQREIQELRLEAADRERTLASLKADLERQRRDGGERAAEAARVKAEGLLGDLVAPVAQMLFQAHLLEVDGRPVQAKDVLLLAKRVGRILEDHGVTFEGRIGEAVAFDPDRHALLGSGASAAPRQDVVVRFPGASYCGMVLLKAGVEPAGSVRT